MLINIEGIRPGDRITVSNGEGRLVRLRVLSVNGTTLTVRRERPRWIWYIVATVAALVLYLFWRR